VRGYRRALDAAEVGALFVRALQAAVDGLPIPKNVPAGTSLDEDDLRRSRKRRVEALAVMAATFQHAHPGRCELEHGPSIAADTARRLACDGSVVKIRENEKGEPLDVGRRMRTIPPGIRRALNARDKGCRFPGCHFKLYVDGHHVKHWADGGETKLSNLVTLCRFHHRLVHEGGVKIRTLDDEAFRFVKPDGETFESPPPASGERLDLDVAVDGLMWRRAASQADPVPAAPPPSLPAPSRPT
jgi:hypothetical protein